MKAHYMVMIGSLRQEGHGEDLLHGDDGVPGTGRTG